jgi:peptidoglycan/xylan/chitin deacetylase (PgdA/CDA1 family)
VNPRTRKLRVLRWLPSRLLLTTGPRGAVYLSFDDGPHPELTPRLLDLLAAHGAHASFFLLGEHVERHPAIVQRMVAEGHLIGNHSYSHPAFAAMPLAAQLAEIDRTDVLLAAFDGRRRHRFRPPRGVLPTPLLLRFARGGRCIAYWSYDSYDYLQHPAEELASRLRSHPPRSGYVVLMHDDDASTLDALAMLLPEWRKAGIVLAALPAESQGDASPARPAPERAA